MRNVISKHREKIEELEKFLRDFLNEELRPRRLYDACRHLLFAGGKRIRPLLVMLTCESVGGDWRSSLPVAAALELIHNFTLIHDDIMDRDEMRRNVPTVHVVYGEPMAILAGDTLFSKSFEIIAFSNIPARAKERIFQEISRASVEVCEGQALDMSFEERDFVSEEEYMEMISKKTGALIRASVVCGAIVGGADDSTIDRLARYGELIGLAFQIRDDILGIFAKEEKLGKPVGSDIAKGKKSLPIIKALELLDDDGRSYLAGVLGKEQASREELERAARLIERCGALDYCREKAVSLAREAMEVIDDLNLRNRDDLISIASFIVERDF